MAPPVKAPVFPEVLDIRLLDFKVRILENKHGTDAIIRVHIESTDGEAMWGTVGASDNISLGESTFMVEMNETATILNNLSGLIM